MQPSTRDVRFMGSMWAHTEELHDPAGCATDMGRTCDGKSWPPLTAGRQGVCTRLKVCGHHLRTGRGTSASESGKAIRGLWGGTP